MEEAQQRVPPALAGARVVSEGTEAVGQILHRVPQSQVCVVEGDQQTRVTVGIQVAESHLKTTPLLGKSWDVEPREAGRGGGGLLGEERREGSFG